MRHKWYWQAWQKIVYRQTKLDKGFSHWSAWVEVKGLCPEKPEKGKEAYLGVLNWLIKRFFWRRYTIFKPHGHADTKFRLGFCSADYKMRLSPIVQRVGDGLFTTRIGPAPMHFFIVGDNPVQLTYYTTVIEDTPVANKYKDIIVY